MIGPDADSRSRVARGRRWMLAGGGLLLVLAAGAWWLMTSRPPRETPVALVADLVRIEGRLVLRTSTNHPFTGLMIARYADGVLKSRSQVSAGVLQGTSEGWHTNGLLQVREHFVKGVAEGPVTKWHPNGILLSEGIARAGRLEGPFRRWHPNGTLAEEVTMTNSRPTGLSRAWFPSGHQKAEVFLEQGVVVRQQFWKDGEQAGLAVAASRTNPPLTGEAP